MMADLIKPDSWQDLRAHTAARIALGRAGSSLPTTELLRFGLAHAQARDAVQRPLDTQALLQALRAADLRALSAHSEARDRAQYLLRPDLGRQLAAASRELLRKEAAAEWVFVIADGLSSVAVQHHALPLLLALRELWSAQWSDIPVVVVEQGRVAIGDDIGALLGARLAVVLIGERPGLSSPDSLGVYLTFEPRVGRRDHERNCISNIRPEGLSYEAAAHKLAFLMCGALRLQQSGVALKDDSDLKRIDS